MKSVLFALLSALILFGCLGTAPSGQNVSKKNGTAIPPLANKTMNESPVPANLTGNQTPTNLTPQNSDRFDRIIEEVMPSEGVELNASWNDLGPKALSSGAIDLAKFSALMARNGMPLTAEQMEILQNGSSSRIRIDRNNSFFVLNMFWAFGLVNRNPVLVNGTISVNKTMIPRYASTGGWPAGNESGGLLMSSSSLLQLDRRQQGIVDSVAANTYRPCCDNPASFPDCNHGMAALGMAEWMAYQNASESSIYRAILAANSYWFPQTYIDTAVFLEESNRTWAGADPKELLSANYSSYSGFQKTLRSLNESVPLVSFGGRC